MWCKSLTSTSLASAETSMLAPVTSLPISSANRACKLTSWSRSVQYSKADLACSMTLTSRAAAVVFASPPANRRAASSMSNASFGKTGSATSPPSTMASSTLWTTTSNDSNSTDPRHVCNSLCSSVCCSSAEHRCRNRPAAPSAMPAAAQRANTSCTACKSTDTMCLSTSANTSARNALFFARSCSNSFSLAIAFSIAAAPDGCNHFFNSW
mmetsp:Transcript_117358/g.339277  ORF Transcript_117358/g.339277 Transcript_117358/m.339277 type:complete len:211 (-) Transcript_117358:1127-1759(-)